MGRLNRVLRQGSGGAAAVAHGQRFGLRRPSFLAVTFAVSLIFILSSQVAFAHASPPGPLWIAGVYDAGDLDKPPGSLTGLVAASRVRHKFGKATAIVFATSRLVGSAGDADTLPAEKPRALQHLAGGATVGRSPPEVGLAPHPLIQKLPKGASE